MLTQPSFFWPGRTLQWLQAVQYQQGSTARNEFCEPFTLVPRGSDPWIRITKPVESSVKKFIRRRRFPGGALSVEGPAKNQFSRTIAFSCHPTEQWLTSVDFPTPAQATMVTTFTRSLAQASSRKAISSSRPKTSLPVTGNLATEIFFGPGLAGDFRAGARESPASTGFE